VEWRSQSGSGQAGSPVPFLVRRERRRAIRSSTGACLSGSRGREIRFRYARHFPSLPRSSEQPPAQSATIPFAAGGANGERPRTEIRRRTLPALASRASPIVECRRIRQKGGEGEVMMARTVVSATSSSPRRCSPRTRTALCVEEASHGRVEGWAKQRAWQGGGKRPRLARRVGGGRLYLPRLWWSRRDRTHRGSPRNFCFGCSCDPRGRSRAELTLVLLSPSHTSAYHFLISYLRHIQVLVHTVQNMHCKLCSKRFKTKINMSLVLFLYGH
jgi:hypothetical protein